MATHTRLQLVPREADTEEATTRHTHRRQVLHQEHRVSPGDTASPEDMVSRSSSRRTDSHRRAIKGVAVVTKAMPPNRTLVDHHVLVREVRRILASRSGHDGSRHSGVGSVFGW